VGDVAALMSSIWHCQNPHASDLGVARDGTRSGALYCYKKGQAIFPRVRIYVATRATACH
jgi:hypothetical protein